MNVIYFIINLSIACGSNATTERTNDLIYHPYYDIRNKNCTKQIPKNFGKSLFDMIFLDIATKNKAVINSNSKRILTTLYNQYSDMQLQTILHNGYAQRCYSV